MLKYNCRDSFEDFIDEKTKHFIIPKHMGSKEGLVSAAIHISSIYTNKILSEYSDTTALFKLKCHLRQRNSASLVERDLLYPYEVENESLDFLETMGKQSTKGVSDVQWTIALNPEFLTVADRKLLHENIEKMLRTELTIKGHYVLRI